MSDNTTTTTAAASAGTCTHVWQAAGECRHGFTGQIEFQAFVCSACGLGGHCRTGAFACARRREKPAERAARIERQVAACPVWDKLSERAQEALRA